MRADFSIAKNYMNEVKCIYQIYFNKFNQFNK